MIDHFNLPVSNIELSTRFYTTVLATLDVAPLMQDKDAVGFGKKTWEFGIVEEPGTITQLHVAFIAGNRLQVQQFHSSAIKAGGHDNGAPGIRAHYGASYYSAYIIDPDGHNIEAVCRASS